MAIDRTATPAPNLSVMARESFAADLRACIIGMPLAGSTTWQVIMEAKAGFAAQLKWWRDHRGLSQLALAGTAEISQRHLSFLERARNAPSREMVLRLAVALDLPLRQQNALLRAAGYAPIWQESALDAPALATVGRALDFILAQQEPYPVFVVDRRWNLLRLNRGGQRLVEFLTGAPIRAPEPAQQINLADALIAPDALRPLIENWSDVALYFIRGVQADALADGTEETAALLRRLMAYPGVPRLSQMHPVGGAPESVLSIHFAKGATLLKLFTTIATLGTPQDVTAQEIRIECFFPADTVTANHFKGWSNAM
jgi:transcriptional regulator with XRE-family HTH domain